MICDNLRRQRPECKFCRPRGELAHNDPEPGLPFREAKRFLLTLYPCMTPATTEQKYEFYHEISSGVDTHRKPLQILKFAFRVANTILSFTQQTMDVWH